MGDVAIGLDAALWRPLVDIGLVAALIYQLLRLLRGSRSAAVLIALAGLFGVFYLSQDSVLDMPTVNWLLDRLIGSIVVLLVVLFQDDIRRALAGAVRAPIWGSGRDPQSDLVLAEVLRAATVLSQRGIGALIVLEGTAELERYAEGGVRIDANVNWQLLVSLFVPSHMNPTHDGAALISKGRIASAACFLPLAVGDDLPAALGSRHRAALGLADETDAIVVVVSEESGRAAVAHMGRLDLELDPDDLRERLRQLGEARRGKNDEGRWRRRIVHHRGSRDLDDRAGLDRITGNVPRVTGEHRVSGEQRVSGEHRVVPERRVAPAPMGLRTPPSADDDSVEEIS